MATDNELFAMMIPYLRQEMTAKNIPCRIVQAYQPTLQSIGDDKADGNGAQVFLFKKSTKRYGWKKVKPTYLPNQPIDEEFEMTYSQKMEATFGAQALVRQNPADLTSLTASDVLYEISEILQSPECISFFNDQREVGILRVVDLPQTYIIDDKDQYESVPNLEFVLTHTRVSVRRAPDVKSEECKIYRV